MFTDRPATGDLVRSSRNVRKVAFVPHDGRPYSRMKQPRSFHAFVFSVEALRRTAKEAVSSGSMKCHESANSEAVSDSVEEARFIPAIRAEVGAGYMRCQCQPDRGRACPTEHDG